MKLKALASLCNEARCVYLFNEEDGTQWAGTGFAIWRLPENLGNLTQDALCAIFDISQEKQGKMVIKTKEMPTAFDTGEYCQGEKDLLYWLDRRVILHGVDLLPTQAPNGEIFTIQTKNLRPGSDAEQPGLALRRPEEGNPYVVYKDGLFVQAIIMPWHAEPETITWLGNVCRGITVEENETV